MDGEFDGQAKTHEHRAKYNSENCFHALPPSVFILSVPFFRVRRVYANVDGEFDGQAGTHECMAERYLDKKMCLNVSTQNGLTSGDIAVSVTSTQIGLLETIASLKPGQTILLHACPSEVADSIKALGLCGLSNWPSGSLWMLKVMSSLHFARASRLIFSQTRSSSASRTKQPTLACSGLFCLGLISWPPKGKSAGKIVCF